MFVYIEAFSPAFLQWQLHCVTGIFYHSHLYERNDIAFASLQLFNMCTKAEFRNLLLILLFLLNINLFFVARTVTLPAGSTLHSIRNAHWPVLRLVSLMTANLMRKF